MHSGQEGLLIGQRWVGTPQLGTSMANLAILINRKNNVTCIGCSHSFGQRLQEAGKVTDHNNLGSTTLVVGEAC